MNKRIIFLLIVLAGMLPTSAVELAKDVIGGNCFSRVLIPSSAASAQLLSIPVGGCDITGVQGTNLTLAVALPARRYPDGTKLYFFDAVNKVFNVYVRDVVNDGWLPVNVVDGDTGLETTAQSATVSPIAIGTSVWVDFPSAGAASYVALFGQLPQTHTMTNLTFEGRPASSSTPSYSLVGFAATRDVVLDGPATAGELKAVWNLPAIVSDNRRAAYQMRIPAADGIMYNYTWNKAKSVWDCKVAAGKTDGRVILKKGCGFWFINPGTSAATVTLQEQK